MNLNKILKFWPSDWIRKKFTIVLVQFEFWRGQVVLVAEEAGVFVGVPHHSDHVAAGVDAAHVPAVAHHVQISSKEHC